MNTPEMKKRLTTLSGYIEEVRTELRDDKNLDRATKECMSRDLHSMSLEANKLSGCKIYNV